MPTLLTLKGFKFFFYANEHEPKHIHILKDECFAKVNLETLSVIKSTFKPKDLKFVLEVVKEHKLEFIRSCNDYFKG